MPSKTQTVESLKVNSGTHQFSCLYS